MQMNQILFSEPDFSHHLKCLRTFTSSLILYGLLVCVPVMAQDPNTTPYPQNQPGNPPSAQPGTASPDIRGVEQIADPVAGDKQFLKDAVEQCVTQVELGKLAQQKASSDAVKEFAARTVNDHEQVNQQLQQVASEANVPVSTDLPRKTKKSQEKLSKLSSAEFDREYTKLMAKEYKNTVKSFDRQAKDGRIPEVKEFATKNLPALKEHQQIAEQLEIDTKK